MIEQLCVDILNALHFCEIAFNNFKFKSNELCVYLNFSFNLRKAMLAYHLCTYQSSRSVPFLVMAREHTSSSRRRRVVCVYIRTRILDGICDEAIAQMHFVRIAACCNSSIVLFSLLLSQGDDMKHQHREECSADLHLTSNTRGVSPASH